MMTMASMKSQQLQKLYKPNMGVQNESFLTLSVHIGNYLLK